MKNFDHAQRVSYLCGIDEVGRGAGAGPVVACAIIMPTKTSFNLTTDSKGLSARKRAKYAALIKQEALAYGIGIVDNKDIDEINILNATKKAMLMAYDNLKITPEFTLIDAVALPINNSKSIIKGDIKSFTIACASIIAKVHRDALMDKYEAIYPGYDFIHNKGYLTKVHCQALNEKGPSPIHRLTFRRVAIKNNFFINKK